MLEEVHKLVEECCAFQSLWASFGLTLKLDFCYLNFYLIVVNYSLINLFQCEYPHLLSFVFCVFVVRIFSPLLIDIGNKNWLGSFGRSKFSYQFNMVKLENFLSNVKVKRNDPAAFSSKSDGLPQRHLQV